MPNPPLQIDPPMHGYQLFAKEFIKTHPKCGLFLSMGTGKTRITLEALYELNEPGHVLVVAPKNIARSTWLDEIRKWNIPIRTKSLIVNEKGRKLSKKKRLERYAQIPTDPPTMYFINRDLLVDLIDNAPMNDRHQVLWYFPTVVIDELQSFKSYAATRFKRLAAMVPAMRRFIGLTGTPAPEGLMDLWSQIYLMDGGERLGGTITSYRNTFFYPVMYVDNHPVKFEPRDGAEDEIYKRIGDIVVSIKNTNLKLPPVTYNTVPVYLDDDELKTYKQFAKDCVLELADGRAIEAVNRGVLYNKLCQFASGTAYTGEGKDFIVLHEKKLEMCDYIIRNSSGPILLAYYYQSEKKLLSERYPNAVIFDGSPEMIDRWNRGEIEILMIHPASAGHGLNLQHGGWTLIWYSIYSNLEHYLQTNARLNRQGQTHPVIIHHLVAQNTMDVQTMRSLERKDNAEQELIDAVEAVIEESI